MNKEEKINKRIKYLRKQLNHSARHKHLRKEDKEEYIEDMLDELGALEAILEAERDGYISHSDLGKELALE